MSTEIPGLVSSGDKFAAKYEWLYSNPEQAKHVPVQIDLAAADAGLPAGYPAGTLRSGLVLGKVTATGLYKQYDNGAADGTEQARGILFHPVRLRDPFGNTLPASTPVFGEMIVEAVVDGTLLQGIDANGRTDLRALGVVFKDEV